MGNGMNKIIPGVYVGNFRDSKDREQLEKYKITHILSIHDNAKKLHEDKVYLCIVASDNPQQELKQFFPECIDFIHNARINDGNVLIHCLAGVSRSVTVTAAYLMTVTSLGWRDAINCIRGARSCANPNFGFQRQLQRYESFSVDAERDRLKTSFKPSPYDDVAECKVNLDAFRKFVLNGDPKEKDDGLYPLPVDAYSNRPGKSANRKPVPNVKGEEGDSATKLTNQKAVSEVKGDHPQDGIQGGDNSVSDEDKLDFIDVPHTEEVRKKLD